MLGGDVIAAQHSLPVRGRYHRSLIRNKVIIIPNEEIICCSYTNSNLLF